MTNEASHLVGRKLFGGWEPMLKKRGQSPFTIYIVMVAQLVTLWRSELKDVGSNPRLAYM